MTADIIGWAGNVFLLLGSYQIAKKRISGFYNSILGNGLWCISGIICGLYSLIAIEAILTLIAVYGIYNWRKK